MSEIANFIFEGREETLRIINSGGDLVEYLTRKNPLICPLFDAEVSRGVLLGEGSNGAAYQVRIQGMGEKDYVVKRTQENYDRNILTFGLPDGHQLTLEQIARQLLSRKIITNVRQFIEDNGGNGEKLFKEEARVIVIKKELEGVFTKEIKKYKRFDEKGLTVVPIGSTVCDMGSLCEFSISLLCGELYRKGISANFFDAFSFVSCDNNKNTIANYIFMEKIDGDMRNIKKCLFEDMDVFPNEYQLLVQKVSLVQIIHAIAVYQKEYQIVHNDLHTGNIFFEFIKQDTIYMEQNLGEADWFHYRVGGVDLYLPWIPFLVKIGDFGLSTKYSEPMIVASTTVLEDGFDPDTPWMPNWFSTSYDALLIIYEFFISQKQKFTEDILEFVTGGKLGSGYNPDNHRPLAEFISERDEAGITPQSILMNKDLMGEFMVRPSTGIIATLGII